MPSVSRAQQKLMHAAAEGRAKTKVSKKVAKEFVAADHARGKTNLPYYKGPRKK